LQVPPDTLVNPLTQVPLDMLPNLSVQVLLGMLANLPEKLAQPRRLLMNHWQNLKNLILDL
jgi:hypothetical protein